MSRHDKAYEGTQSYHTLTWETMFGRKTYHALLLEPVDETLRKFKRVGVALMKQEGWDAMDKTMKDFEII